MSAPLKYTYGGLTVQTVVACLQPDAEKQSDYSYSALALLPAGSVAPKWYLLLSARSPSFHIIYTEARDSSFSTLTDIAKSIALYLHDQACPHRILAIDLGSPAFQVRQHYVDAMEVLRALFSLATSAEKERNGGPQARQALLQIATSNTPLFI